MFRTLIALSTAFLALAAIGATDWHGGKPAPPPKLIAPLPQEPMPPGTVAHWCFWGESGSVAPDESSLMDSTRRFRAVIFGGPMYRLVENRPGLEFNGGDDRIFVKDDPALALTASLTLEAIIRYDGPAPHSFEHQIVFRGDDRGGLDPWCLYVTPDGRLLFHIDDGANHQVELLSPTILPSKIMSVAATLDDRSGEMRLYIDGKLVGSAVTSVRPMAQLDTAANPGIGIGNVQSTNYKEAFNGLISEVRISNRALRPEEMLVSQSRFHPATGTVADAPGDSFPSMAQVGGCRIEHGNGQLRLLGPTTGRSLVQTIEEYRPPLALCLRAKTDSTSVRLYYSAGMVILNWEDQPTELRLHDPVDDSVTALPEKGAIETGKFYDIVWEVYPDGTRLLIDGREIMRKPGEYGDLRAPVGIGPAFGSVLTLESFHVEPLQGTLDGIR